MRKLTYLALAVFSVASIGCSSEASATKEEEKAYRNPPKAMPAEASAAMAKGMAANKGKGEGGNGSSLKPGE